MRPLKAYLQFKSKFYLAYTYTYVGQQLFAEEKCGDSLKAYQQAQAALSEAEALGKAYKRATVSRWSYHSPGPLTACDHTVFTTLQKTLRGAADKSRRENDFIYYHKVPVDDLPLPESRAMAKPTQFDLPAVSERWTEAKFNITMVPKKGEVRPKYAARTMVEPSAAVTARWFSPDRQIVAASRRNGCPKRCRLGSALSAVAANMRLPSVALYYSARRAVAHPPLTHSRARVPLSGPCRGQGSRR